MIITKNRQDYEIVAEIGSSKLRRYPKENHVDDKILLIIPSVINKSYILDLDDDLSLVRFLMKDNNIVIYLVEFNDPLICNSNFGFLEYVDQILAPFLNIIYLHHNKNISLLGYCLGGIFATSLASRFNDIINNLILIATPWSGAKVQFLDIVSLADRYLKLYPGKIVDKSIVYQCLVMLNIEKYIEKYIKIRMINDIKILNKFVKVENWVLDGINITAKMAKEIFSIYLENNLLLNGKIGDLEIKFSHIKSKNYIFIALNDYLVPKESAIEITRYLSNVEEIYIDSGHLGMIISDTKKDELYFKLKEIL